MVCKGFRQRVVRYAIFLSTFLLLFALWAALLGRYSIIPNILAGIPFSLLIVLGLDIIGLGHRVSKQKGRKISYLILAIAIIAMVADGELLLSVPFIVMLAWIIGYVLRQQLSMRGGQATPPQA